MSTRNSQNTLILTALLLAVAIVAIWYFDNRNADGSHATPPGSGVACTLEAKLCPDGSYVGRVPPSCEFAACPASQPANS